MKHRRKLWYEIRVPDMWWCGRRLGWIKDLSSVDYIEASSLRTVLTSRKAFRYTASLPIGTIITRWFIRNGVGYTQDFKKLRQE